MSRAVESWQGATDDAAIPTRVKLRIWARCEGRCGLTGRKIMPGEKYEFDHIVPLILGGAHAEFNIHVVLATAHKAKTREDVGRKAKADRTRAKHLGLAPKGRGWNTKLRKRLDGRVEPR